MTKTYAKHAAAPELLAAAKELAKCLPPRELNALSIAANDALDLLKAAIAKAQGE